MTSRCNGLCDVSLNRYNYSGLSLYRKHGFLNTLFNVKSTLEYGRFLFPGIFDLQLETPGLLDDVTAFVTIVRRSRSSGIL